MIASRDRGAWKYPSRPWRQQDIDDMLVMAEKQIGVAEMSRLLRRSQDSIYGKLATILPKPPPGKRRAYKRPRVNVYLSLPPDVLSKIDFMSRRRKQTRSRIIEAAIRDYLDKVYDNELHIAANVRPKLLKSA